MALVTQASQVPIPEHDDGLVPRWGDMSDSDSDDTVLCGTPLSSVSACHCWHANAIDKYDAKLDPESPNYVNKYTSEWRKVAWREAAGPHDVQSRKTGVRWRPTDSRSVESVGDIEALNFFRGPPVPV